MVSVLVLEEEIKGPWLIYTLRKKLLVGSAPCPGREHSKKPKKWHGLSRCLSPVLMQKEESAGTAFWGISREILYTVRRYGGVL